MKAGAAQAVWGEHLDNITSKEALALALSTSAGYVYFLENALKTLGVENFDTPEAKVLKAQWNVERDRLARVAKLCSDADVDQARINVLATQVTMLGMALLRAADRVGLSDAVKRRLGEALRLELAEAEPVTLAQIGQ